MRNLLIFALASVVCTHLQIFAIEFSGTSALKTQFKYIQTLFAVDGKGFRDLISMKLQLCIFCSSKIELEICYLSFLVKICFPVVYILLFIFFSKNLFNNVLEPAKNDQTFLKIDFVEVKKRDFY